MKRFLVIMQGSEGCDYTMGCNIKFEILEAASLESVRDQIIKSQLEEEFGDVKEYGVEDVSIYEINDSLEFVLGDYARDYWEHKKGNELLERENSILAEAELIKLKRKT